MDTENNVNEYLYNKVELSKLADIPFKDRVNIIYNANHAADFDNEDVKNLKNKYIITDINGEVINDKFEDIFINKKDITNNQINSFMIFNNETSDEDFIPKMLCWVYKKLSKILYNESIDIRDRLYKGIPVDEIYHSYSYMHNSEEDKWRGIFNIANNQIFKLQPDLIGSSNKYSYFNSIYSNIYEYIIDDLDKDLYKCNLLVIEINEKMFAGYTEKQISSAINVINGIINRRKLDSTKYTYIFYKGKNNKYFDYNSNTFIFKDNTKTTHKANKTTRNINKTTIL